MSANQYGFTGELKHGKHEFYVHGTIDSSGSTTVYFSERGEGTRRFVDTVVFDNVVSEQNVSRLLQLRLGSHLGCSAKTVAVVVVRLSRVSGSLEAARNRTALHKVSCQFTRDGKSYLAYGDFVDGSLAFDLRLFDPHPNGAGGGTYGRGVLVDTLSLRRDVTGLQLEEYVQNQLHRRVARYLRCALRMVSVAHFRMYRHEAEDRKGHRDPKKIWRAKGRQD